MSRSKPPIVALSALEPGQFADCFVLLVERKPGMTAAGKPYFLCRFRDDGRTGPIMVWADGGHFEECEHNWQTGKCYKLRCVYSEHEKYGPQIEIHQIRLVTRRMTRPTDTIRCNSSSDLAATRTKCSRSCESLCEAEIADEPLRKLVLHHP